MAQAAKDNIFLIKWWRQGGRIVMCTMICFTIVSIVTLLLISFWLMKYYTIPFTSDYLCAKFNQTKTTGGYTIVILLLLISIWLMI